MENETTPLKVVDLFAGCGGLSEGFSQAGYEIVAAFDSWEPAIECYRQNFPDHKAFNMDLSDTNSAIKAIQEFAPDVLIGGPPCQDFSQAGTRVERDRAVLTTCFAQIVQGVSPQYFVMENVARARNSQAYAAARRLFKAAGFGLSEVVLDASLYGVPQKRKRFFVVGGKDFEDGELLNALEKRESLIPSTVRSVYPDFAVEYYYRHPRSYSRRAVFSIDEPAPTMRGVSRPRPKNYTFHKNDASQSADIRALTPQERALIQTFPDRFIWTSKSVSDLEQMIGNAVPVGLAKVVGEALREHIGDMRAQETPSFRRWLNEAKNLSSESLKDVVSHIRRANAIVPFSEDEDPAEYLARLQAHEGFKEKTVTSRSQMKRALDLYIEHRRSDIA